VTSSAVKVEICRHSPVRFPPGGASEKTRPKPARSVTLLKTTSMDPSVDLFCPGRDEQAETVRTLCNLANGCLSLLSGFGLAYAQSSLSIVLPDLPAVELPAGVTELRRPTRRCVIC